MYTTDCYLCSKLFTTSLYEVEKEIKHLEESDALYLHSENNSHVKLCDSCARYINKPSKLKK